jgi:hypothetical protein
MAWVIDEAPDDLAPSEMLVALILANHTTKDGGHAYPSIRTLADETRLGERTVQAALRSLIERGIIAVQASHTRRLPTMYEFPQFRGADSAPHPGLGVHAMQSEVQKTAIRGAKSAPNPLEEPLEEPSEKYMPPARGRYTEEFEQFWKPYPPTNGSKADAFKAWKQLSAGDRAAAIAALPAWLACDRWREGYVKHAGSWLRGRMWEVAPAPRASPNGSKPEERRPSIPRFESFAHRYGKEGS